MEKFIIIIHLQRQRQSKRLTYQALSHLAVEPPSPNGHLVTGLPSGGVRLVFLTLMTIFIFCFFSAENADASVILGRPFYLDLNQNLAGYWSFNQQDMAQSPNDTYALDLSGNGNRGQLVNMSTSSARVIGKIGQALNFDGVDDYVYLASPAALNLSGVMSAFMWVEFDDVIDGANGDHFLAQCNSLGTGGQFTLDVGRTDNKITIGWADISHDVSSASLKVGNWYYIGFVRSGASGAWTSTIYINGVAETPVTGIATNPGSQSATSIGKCGDFGLYADGVLDDIRIYSRVLTPQEIQRLYRIGATLKLGASRSNDTLSHDLVGHWTFDGKDTLQSSQNTRVLDMSGQGNTGKLVNMSTTSARVVGKLGQALNFDGVDDYVTTNKAVNCNTSGGVFAISAWIYPTVSNTTILTFDNNAYSGGLAMSVESGNAFGAYCLNTTSTLNTVVSTNANTISLNQWQHIVMIYDNTTSPDTITVYINGTRMAINISSAADVEQSGPFLIQKIGGPFPGQAFVPANYFKGKIDDVRMYSRALTPQEIQRLYRIGATLKLGASRSNDTLGHDLVGYWTFDGKDTLQSSQNTRVLDMSGQGNTGKLVNMSTTSARVVGKLGQALNFDGVDDYVSISDPGTGSVYDFGSGSTISISAWINPDQTYPIGSVNFGEIATKGLSDNVNFRFQISDATPSFPKRPSLWFTSATNVYHGITSTSDVIVPRAWQHVAIVFTYGTGGTFYYNGSSVGSQTLFGTPTSIPQQTNNPIQIGAVSDASIYAMFKGQIDDVRMYNRALTPDEIKRLYNLGR